MSHTSQMPMQTPQDLFVHELSDMLSAEQIIVTMLQEAQGVVSNPQLQQGLQLHETQTRQHAERLQQVLQMVGGQPHPVECHAAAGLRQSLQEGLQAKPSAQVIDGLVTGGACKTEHLEIAAYTGLVEKARALGQLEAAQLLSQTLREETEMLRQVEQISQQLTQQMGSMASSQAD